MIFISRMHTDNADIEAPRHPLNSLPHRYYSLEIITTPFENVHLEDDIGMLDDSIISMRLFQP